MMDSRETVHQGWLDFCTDSATPKSWLSKKWKKRYFVLYHLNEDIDKVYLASYEKDENWHLLEPKKILELFPRYKIAKLQNYRGRENVLEVNNEREQWYLSNNKLKIIDLWSTQVQMQTKLSRAISGRIFSVSGAVNKQMQKIGAAQQRCLLHFTRWGITLALQDSRAILAMWPLKTIRNYESSSQCQFSIEAGRRAPMGEGLYVFNTNIGQDEEMFNVVDAFVAASLSEKAELSPNKKEPTTDEEILKTYDMLHRSATGMNSNMPAMNEDIDTPGYAPLGGRMSAPHDSISIYKPPDYDNLYRDRGSSRRKYSDNISPSSSLQGFETPRGLSFSDTASNYDQLDRKESLASTSYSEYDHIHQKKDTRRRTNNPYDKIDRTPHGFGIAVSERAEGYGSPVNYPLRDEPSVPFLSENDEKPFLGRSPLSVTPDDMKYEFRNSIYSPTKEEMNVKSEFGLDPLTLNSIGGAASVTPIGTSYDHIDIGSRNNSLTSELEPVGFVRTKQRTSSSFKDKSMQDIADHFLYQMPSSFSNKDLVREAENESLYETDGPNALAVNTSVEECDTMYQNSDSVRDSVFTKK